MNGVKKRTHTTNLLYSMDIEPVVLKIKKNQVLICETTIAKWLHAWTPAIDWE